VLPEDMPEDDALPEPLFNAARKYYTLSGAILKLTYGPLFEHVSLAEERCKMIDEILLESQTRYGTERDE
jgi:hypothetical protein